MSYFYPNWLIATIKPLMPPLLMNPISRVMYRFRCWRYRADLNKLAILYGTDKNGSHFYTQHYQRYFSEWRLQPLRVLEIGVGGYENTNEGAWSLRMWKRFFPNAQIVGIDLYDKSHLSEDRITVLQADQTDEKRLAEISKQFGPFDIIIDDGSHLNEHVIKTFGILFPLLKNPGFYAVEDLQTAYWPSWGGIKDRSSMDYLKSLTDGINHAEHPNRTIEEFDTQIPEIAFFHNLCILRKGDNKEPSNAPHFVAEEAAKRIAS
ncbi:bifunctional 2-polyprenyl-6-hydroxyphenol methylase/3-demethylubiquinol 3-O-methyltransferase UbiG [Granulicella sp. S190]|uniref:class I SAM-dependent methyltransferase n=1 Tax=Granulicella sp. S190 TaxID=1747226 RepID=UPI00131AAEC6|nr:class I SAM-dependent methyltransferase [Granulicella sp. S190]